MTDDRIGAIPLDVNAADLPGPLAELPRETEPGAGPVILAVTPGVEGTGWASMAAVTIATHWGDDGHPICLVDAGLEEPALHGAVGEGNDVGLVDHFLYGVSLAAVVRPVLGDAFRFVAAGTYPPDPDALLRHEGWAELLDALADDGRIAVVYLPVALPGAGKLVDRAARVVVLAEEDETLPDPVTDALDEGRGRRFAPDAGEEAPEAAGGADDDLGLETGFGFDEAGEDAGPAGEDQVSADPFADLGRFDEEAVARPDAEEGDEEGEAVEGLESSFDFGSGKLEMEDEDDDFAPPSTWPVEGPGEEPGAPAREPEAPGPEAPEEPGAAPPGAPSGGAGGSPRGPGGGPGAPAGRKEIPSRKRRSRGGRRRTRRKKGRGSLLRPALLVLVVAVAGFGAWQYFGGGGTPAAGLTEIIPGEWWARIPFLGAGSGETAGTGEAGEPAEPVPSDLRWAVVLDSYSDLATARRRIDRLAEVEPTVNFFIAPVGGGVSRFYRLLAGPFPDTTRAIAVGDLLGDRSLGSDPGGYLLRETPLGYEVGTYDDRGSAEERATGLRDRRIPAYIVPIPYSDGSERYRIYAGAYADAEEAGLLGSILADAGVDAELVRLQGRYAE